MKYTAPLLIVLLLFTLWQSKEKQAKSIKEIPSHTTPPQHTIEATNRYSYIVDVIQHGSSKLHFKKEEKMEGGFASDEDAPKIACYLLYLASKPCPNGYPKEAQMYYSSNCAGCHGEDAKGLGGTYPDLTKDALLGMEKENIFTN
jgi:cytochrome c553